MILPQVRLIKGSVDRELHSMGVLQCVRIYVFMLCGVVCLTICTVGGQSLRISG